MKIKIRLDSIKNQKPRNVTNVTAMTSVIGLMNASDSFISNDS